MKLLLNRFDDPKLSGCVYVGKGDYVFAGHGADEFGFTVGEKYEIQDISPFGYLVMKNDAGEIEEYTVELFQEYKSML